MSLVADWISDRFEPGPFWTVPNGISLLRMALALPVALLIARDGPFAWILGLTLTAIVSDWLDGWLARWTRRESEWGRILDPVADKVAAAAVVGALFVDGSLPLWFLGVVVSRDLLILAGGAYLARRIGRVVVSNRIGKSAAAALALTVMMALLDADPGPMRWTVNGTAVLLCLSILRYGYRFLRLQGESREQGDGSFPEAGDAPGATA